MGTAVIRAGALAIVGTLVLAWLGLDGFAWSDYDYATAGPVATLLSGDVGTFLRTAPVEGPSLLMRLPLALVTSLLGGGELAVYRALAVPCLLAGIAFAAALVVLRRRAGHRGWEALTVLLIAANPITLRALGMSHPEELLGGVLAVGAVLAARAGRPWITTLLLGLAIGNKAWAVLAIGPVLLALPRDRVRTLLVSGAIAAVFVLPFVLATSPLLGEPTPGGTLVTQIHSTNGEMRPWQLWWGLGTPSDDTRGYDGVAREDWRVAAPWVSRLSHPLIVGLMVPLCLLFLRRRRQGDVLALLALLLALRCVLDTVDNGYYHLPLVLALAAWEATTRRGPPVATLAVSLLVWLSVDTFATVLTPDGQWVLYLAWALPGTAWLAGQAYGLPIPRRRGAPAVTAPAPA